MAASRVRQTKFEEVLSLMMGEEQGPQLRVKACLNVPSRHLTCLILALTLPVAISMCS